jgi:hypothetical protein
MKSSPPSGDHLTPQQLEDFLGRKLDLSARSKAEQLLEECELSREAVAGFSAVPGALAEIPALRQAIAEKSGLAAPKTWRWILSGAIVLAGIGLLAFFLWPVPQPQAAPLVSENIAAPVNTGTPPAVSLNPQSEHFVNPEAKAQPDKIVAAKTDSAISHPAPVAVNPQDDEVPVADPEETKPVIPKKPEPGYNASVGFVLDLKVTEYDKLYKGVIVQKETPLPGVPAQFEDKDSRDRAKDDAETVREIPKDKYLVEGLQAFRDERYGRCIEKMEQLRKNNPSDINAAFYMGVSYVKLEMYGKAIPYFDEILGATNNVFYEEARWYKAQALMGMGNREEGIKLLEEIAAQEGFYQAKAREMLK